MKDKITDYILYFIIYLVGAFIVSKYYLLIIEDKNPNYRKLLMMKHVNKNYNLSKIQNKIKND